jgi:hypothetical protein
VSATISLMLDFPPELKSHSCFSNGTPGDCNLGTYQTNWPKGLRTYMDTSEKWHPPELHWYPSVWHIPIFRSCHWWPHDVCIDRSCSQTRLSSMVWMCILLTIGGWLPNWEPRRYLGHIYIYLFIYLFYFILFIYVIFFNLFIHSFIYLRMYLKIHINIISLYYIFNIQNI